MNENIQDSITNFMQDSNIDLDTLHKVVQQMCVEKANQKAVEVVEINAKLVGNCYYDYHNNIYIKVISARSTNQYRVECLVFEMPPKYYFKHHLYSVPYVVGNNYFGEFIFDSIYVDSILITDLEQFVPITLKDYNNILRRWVEYIINMDWKP